MSNRMAAKHTGRAFFTSALTTLGGFAVLMFSSLPLLADFGMVVTINIAVALLSALVVVPPLVKEADRRGLLAMGPDGAHDHTRGRRVMTGWIGGAVIAALGIVVVAVSAKDNQPALAASRATETVEAPATIPATTTTIPRSTTTALPPGETLPAGETIPPPETLPPGPPERPAGLVSGGIYDLFTSVGVDPGIANCAGTDLVATTSEADLLGMGIASKPPPAAVTALVDASAKLCGVTQAQLDAAGAASGG
jgi:hypothetical protein